MTTLTLKATGPLKEVIPEAQQTLATGDALAWRLWQACIRDRAQLLAEVGLP